MRDPLLWSLAATVILGCAISAATAAVREMKREGDRITLQEVAVPKTAGAYYRAPGAFIVSEAGDRWFGPEIDSLVLCDTPTHRFNNAGFFDIVYTREDARVWPSATPGKVWWYRKQEWRFASAETPWGTDTVYITLASELNWMDIDAGESVTGFPWSGTEEHWREGDIVKAKADIVGYYPYQHANRKYLAPKYVKQGTSAYDCATARTRFDLKVRKHTEGHFTEPRVRPGTPYLSRREKGTDNWYDCIPLK